MTIERLSAHHAAEFERFLLALDANGDAQFFHPHGFSASDVGDVIAASLAGLDEYWVGLNGGQIIAYGMLRGWREGYAIPSLGIALHPGARGRGLSRAMMAHLHEVAKSRGARTVRLTVDTRNHGAIKLYESLGYQLSPHDGQKLIGFLTVQ